LKTLLLKPKDILSNIMILIQYIESELELESKLRNYFQFEIYTIEKLKEIKNLFNNFYSFNIIKKIYMKLIVHFLTRRRNL